MIELFRNRYRKFIIIIKYFQTELTHKKNLPNKLIQVCLKNRNKKDNHFYKIKKMCIITTDKNTKLFKLEWRKQPQNFTNYRSIPINIYLPYMPIVLSVS